MRATNHTIIATKGICHYFSLKQITISQRKASNTSKNCELNLYATEMSLTTYFTPHLVVTVDQVVGEVIVGGTCTTHKAAAGAW